MLLVSQEVQGSIPRAVTDTEIKIIKYTLEYNNTGSSKDEITDELYSQK
jgi:hypothetical protein